MTLQVLNNRAVKALAVGAAVSLGAAALPGQAEAGHHGTGAAIAGIAAAAIIGGIIASQHKRRYYDHGYYAPPPPPYAYAPATAYRYAPAPSYGYAPEPWSPEWYDYCSRKYRSFDPGSGTFQPYHGPRQLCR